MKKILLLLTLIIGMNLFTAEAQGIKIDETTIIKDVEGNNIDLDLFSKLMSSGEWMIDSKTDDGGNSFIQLRKATKQEKEMIQKMMKDQISNSDMIGKEASEFSLTDMDGNSITSENTKGKVLVFNFWFTTCKPCINEIPELNKIHKKYKNNENIVFASITFNQKPKVENFLKKYPINYPVISDDKDVISAFGISGYPTNLIIGKDGKIADAIVGGFPMIGDHIESAIETALKAN
ncbi:TlpA family protein disulfide reductase [Winogradskyella sp. PE311]|uniref:TlpA family protein disulfide reductase n=1 Tax=Winogradskyella sp. PE311 TaxID=3366943 RepID=UPI00397F3028